MPTRAHLPFDTIYEALKAAAEATRLRILALLAEAELTVSDLTAILRQSQPRISRHLRLLAEAGLVERFREGSWAFFRLGDRGDAAKLARELIAHLDPEDVTLSRDRERLAAVRAQRAQAAQNYFRQHAAEWDRIRKLHVADEAVEAAIIGALADAPVRALLDLGTGTGACSNCSRRRSSAASGLICPSTCSRSRARGLIVPDCGIAACVRAISTISHCPRTVSMPSSSTRSCTSSRTARAR